MPLPPYLLYASLLGLRHRHFMLLHILYSLVLDPPCVVLTSLLFFERKHPQDLVRLLRLPVPTTSNGSPQQHRHLHPAFFSLDSTKLPTLHPLKSPPV